MEQRARLILASQSAIRLALLERAGLAVQARPARIDETAVKQAARADGLSASDTAVLLAEMKAARVARHEPDAVVIAADQMLVCGETWFDKPADPAGARAQLLALRGRPHVLVTAVLCSRGGNVLWRHVETPRLTMRPFPDSFLEAYLAGEGEAVTASVGAYRLEGPGVQLFERLDGDYFTILGLPLLPLLGFLRQHGALD